MRVLSSLSGIAVSPLIQNWPKITEAGPECWDGYKLSWNAAKPLTIEDQSPRVKLSRTRAFE